MSFTLQGLAWSADVRDGTELIVLLALADFANPISELAWPSVETLAKKARRSARTVQSTLRALAEAGHISPQGTHGRRGPVVYRIHPVTAAKSDGPAVDPQGVAGGDGCEICTPGPGGEPGDDPGGPMGAGSAPLNGAGVQSSHPRGATAAPKPKGNLSTSRFEEREAGARATSISDFGTWFAAYPWRTNERGARRVWASAVAAGRLPALAVLVAATRAYRASNPEGRQRRQWLNPATFLADERWREFAAGEGPAAPRIAGPAPEPLPEALMYAVVARCGEVVAETYLAGARLEANDLTPRTHTAWERLKANAGFMAVLAAHGLALVEPAVRPPAFAEGCPLRGPAALSAGKPP